MQSHRFFFLYFTLVLFINSLFYPIEVHAQSKNVIVGPVSVVGQVSIAESQILFNHLRDKLNTKYFIVSHKVLDLISERGFSSIDIEDCTNSRCVRGILDFVKELRKEFNTNDLFLYQIVRSRKETQFSLKLTSLSQPKVIKRIITMSCQDCNLQKLKLQVDILVERMGNSSISEGIEENKTPVDSEKVAPIREAIVGTKETKKQKEVTKSHGEKIPKEPKNSLTEEDPYILSRDLYNGKISELLIDVTYALQIFRSGMIVQIEVIIDHSGKVVSQKILNSSGSKDFDETAIMSLELTKFPPLPKNMRKFGEYVVILQIQNSR